MTRAAILAVGAVVLAGCAGDGSYIVVTVESRPAVRAVASLKITLSNADSSATKDFLLDDAPFPTTFSILPTGRTGDLGIAIDAYDVDGLVVASGSTTSPIDAAATTVMIEPTDFVVNTEFAADQQLSNYYGANGFQLAATSDGVWTVVYNANCDTPCNVFGRRFDATAKPLYSTAAAGTQGFPISSQLTTSFSTPAVATSGGTTVAVWNHDDPAQLRYSIECRTLDRAGAASAQNSIASDDEFPNIVSVAALANGNFVATWDGRVTNTIIRTAIIRPDCTALGPITTVSQSAATVLPGRSHVAANGASVLHAWVVDGAVHVRPADSAGAFTAPDIAIVAKRATEQVEFVRVAPLGAEFAVVVRWVLSGVTSGPGRIELYRVRTTGAVMGAPTVVTERTGSDLASSESFGVAGQPEGAVLVVWHSCDDHGDGSGCGVFGRIIRPSGSPIGDEFGLATTTVNDQIGPSAVSLPDGAFATAWTDRSGGAPDSSGTAVRARIIYPAY